MTDVIFRQYGAQELVRALRGMPLNVRRAVLAKMQVIASDFSTYVKEDKLSGQVLNAVTGKLRAGVYAQVYSSQSRVTMSSGVRGDVPYAGIHEFGGHTSAHEISAVKANVLAYMVGGKMRFARSVQHPGSVMPERSYMRSSLRDKQESFKDVMNETILETSRGG